MSYDLSILNADTPLEVADWQHLQSFLAELPGLTTLDSRHFQYDDGMYQPTFTLDYVDEEGNSLLFDQETFEDLDENDERIKGKANRIDVSIPFGADPTEIIEICLTIADELGWKVLDHQTGQYASINADKSLILFHKPGFGLDAAQQVLSKRGLTATRQADSLLVQWYDGPLLTVQYFDGPEIAQQIKTIAHGTEFEAELRNFDAQLQITFDSLDEVLDEINTLIEVQATLQDATQGFSFNTWNEHLLAPES